MHFFLLQQEAEALLTTHQVMKILWVLTQTLSSSRTLKSIISATDKPATASGTN